MKMLKTLTFCLAISAAPAFAEKLSLDQISAYLNTIEAAETSFTQINADNSVSSGQLYIKRPGRARFEYDPPDAALVMAFGGELAIFDKKSNEPPQSYPLRRTPLWVILEKNVDLKDRDVVIGHDYDGAMTLVTAHDPKRPEYGAIQLKFSESPVRLEEWVIFDGHGGETTVVLNPLEPKPSMSNEIFNISRMKAELIPESGK